MLVQLHYLLIHNRGRTCDDVISDSVPIYVSEWMSGTVNGEVSGG